MNNPDSYVCICGHVAGIHNLNMACLAHPCHCKKYVRRGDSPEFDVAQALYDALQAMVDAVKGDIRLITQSPEMALAEHALKLYEQTRGCAEEPDAL